MTEFSKIGLIGRLASDNTQSSLKRLATYLTEQGCEVMLDEQTSAVLPDAVFAVMTRDQLADQCDLIIVVGGDGSLLSAGRSFAGRSVKLLGVNRGRLGFLTDIHPDEIERRVGEVLVGEYDLEQRFLLSSLVVRKGKKISEGLALNDVVVHPGKFIRMVEFELFVNDEFVYRQRSDGLIISTPTGSTAYALSGGGPIMHPNLDAIVLVPMNPHALNSRPIVINGSSHIKLIVADHHDLHPHVTCDGQTHVISEPGDEVHVCKSPGMLQLIHPKGHSFYESCRTKLGWASQSGSDKL